MDPFQNLITHICLVNSWKIDILAVKKLLFWQAGIPGYKSRFRQISALEHVLI